MRLSPILAVLWTSVAVAVSAPTRGADVISLEELAELNVALSLNGFTFPGGMTTRADGKPTCDGTEIEQVSWVGSGFVVQPDGTILTNYHVAAKSLRGTATFESGETFEISGIRSYDITRDLAFLQLKATRAMKFNLLGDSTKLRPLDSIVAVGNPGGLGINYTDGKVSQVVRSRDGKPELIRHTAAIAPGNSGGALYRGREVIGVNVSTWFGTQFHNAVPIDLAKALLQVTSDNVIPLAVAFHYSGESISRKYQRKSTTKGLVPAEGVTFPLNLVELNDYVFKVDTLQTGDIDILLSNENGELIACAGSSHPSSEILLYSATPTGEVTVKLLNHANAPREVEFSVGVVRW